MTQMLRPTSGAVLGTRAVAAKRPAARLLHETMRRVIPTRRGVPFVTEPAPLPSLFGRFTAILRDHEHLGTTLKSLRAMCTALEARDAVPESAGLLAQLHADLSGHFAAEEAESYFGTMVQESPSLAPRIGQLKDEHVQMLSALVALGSLADDPMMAAELSLGARRLIAELERHERDESLLLGELLSPRR